MTLLKNLENLTEKIDMFKKENADVIVNHFLPLFQNILEDIKEEAFLTPAGQRWFRGQLQIYKNIHMLNENSVHMIFESKSNDFNRVLNYFKNISGDLEKIIKSGKSRYISG
jgi:hypothetical protein